MRSSIGKKTWRFLHTDFPIENVTLICTLSHKLEIFILLKLKRFSIVKKTQHVFTCMIITTKSVHKNFIRLSYTLSDIFMFPSLACCIFPQNNEKIVISFSFPVSHYFAKRSQIEKNPRRFFKLAQKFDSKFESHKKPVTSTIDNNLCKTRSWFVL